METFRIALELHRMPGAGYYELSMVVAAVSLVAQYYLKKHGKLSAAELAKGLTLLGLGAIFVESIMKMLRLMGSVLGV